MGAEGWGLGAEGWGLGAGGRPKVLLILGMGAGRGGGPWAGLRTGAWESLAVCMGWAGFFCVHMNDSRHETS